MIRKAVAALLAVGVFPATGQACSVCFSSAMDGAALRAYYTVTAFMTGAALLILAGFYFFIFRRYLSPNQANNFSEKGLLRPNFTDEAGVSSHPKIPVPTKNLTRF